jgi:DNA-binding transcriptional LysR family regulator
VDVDTRVLRYFVAIAERLSFTRAAKDLYVSQPVLSRQIKQLEDELGAALFERSGQGTGLTATGAELLPLARNLLKEWQETTRFVRSAAADETNILRVGFVVAGGGILAGRARGVLAARHPQLTLQPKRFDWGGEAEALRQGLADVAYLWLPADTAGLQFRVVARERRWVALATDHPLTSRAAVSINDLNDDRLMWTRKASREWVDWWAVNPRPDGSEPKWGPENDNIDEMLEHIATGSAIGIGSESMTSYYTHPGLAWRRITDIPPLRIALAWAEALPRACTTSATAIAEHRQPSRVRTSSWW